MRRIITPFLILCLTAHAGQAAERKFPYEAVIDVEEEFVRSGNGRNFYPTSVLHRGDRVIVHRHDPGGWVMIAPPKGSFSWIQADHVHRKHGHEGTVTDNNVIVRIGSEFNDERDWYQRDLSKGDAVEILGEKTFETERGPVKMLKIKPPAHEYRWIMGKALLPADAPIRKPMKQGDIAAKPEHHKTPLHEKDVDPFADGPSLNSDVIERPLHRDKHAKPVEETDSVRQTGPDAAEREQMRLRLAAVDDQFRAMIKDDPPAWNLIGLEQQYRQLEELTDLPAFKTQIKSRLDAVQRYSKLKQEYEEFIRVTTETKQRDAQLTSLKNPSSGQPPASDIPAPNLGSPQPAKSPPATARQFDGAGLIQRSASNVRGAPQYALVAPDGRFLAYLQPAPGVDLNPYVGQAMAVIGQRSYRQELQAELIIVRSLQPVRLKGGT